MHEAHGYRKAGPGMAQQYAMEDRFDEETAVRLNRGVVATVVQNDCMEAGKFVLHDGFILMNGERIEWPPRDYDGAPIAIGSKVYGSQDTFNGQEERAFTVGSLRLQYQGAHPQWVACAYDDDDSYFEAWADSCKVIEAVPQCG